MRTVRTHPIPALAVAAISALAVLASASAFAAPGQKGNLAHALKKTVLVFPIDVAGASASNSGELSALLTDVVGSRLTAGGSYSVTTYYKAWAPVARAHNDQTLTDSDVTSPFAEDNRKALKIGKLVAYDHVCIGSVDAYQYNESDNQVSVTVSGRILDVVTGKVIKNVTLSATSDKGGKAKEEERNVQAVRSAGDKLMAQLAPAGGVAVAPAVPPTDGPGKKRGANGWVWGLLAVALGVGIGLAGGSSSSGGGIDNPPPPPN